MSEDFELDEMKEIIDSFIVEVAEHIDSLDQNLVELEENKEDADLLNRIFRAAHTIKGAASFLDFDLMAKVTHHAESVLDALRKGKLKVTPEIMDVILESVDVIKNIFESIKETYKEDKSIDIQSIINKLDNILNESPQGEEIAEQTNKQEEKSDEKSFSEEKPEEKKVEAKKEEEQLEKKEESQIEEKAEKQEKAKQSTVQSQDKATKRVKRKEVESIQTIRVDLKRIDNVMNLVQELVPGRNRLVEINKIFKEKLTEAHKEFEEVYKKLEGDNGIKETQAQRKARKKFGEDILQLTELYDEVTSQIDLITTELQLAVMKTRMLPISNVFNKFPRMVRDLAREAKKEIKLEMEGKETELDKSVIEIIGDPLMHTIRNSVDHGIEPPDEREKEGKPREGKIILRAYHEGNYIVVKVIDDGRGINPEKILQKAIEKGIYTEEEARSLTRKDILNIIFHPGFSTAEKVTNISGRGVGMDVLKSNIERLNGIIDVESEIGEGTTVTIKIPLTLAIIQALLVRVKDEVYAIPLASVIETVRILRTDVKTVKNNFVYKLREEIIPLISLADVFDVNSNWQEKEYVYVVVLGIAEKRIGLVVDGLLGQEEIVVKSLGDFFEDTTGIAGATIMGDGRVRLIVNVSDLVDIATKYGSTVNATL